jgi:geranylgeranyl diphosphate synthase type 3
MGLYDYLFSHSNKDIRISLIIAFNTLLYILVSSLFTIIKVVDILYIFSLLIDDIQDSSILRRGVPIIYNIFGVV